MSSPLPQHVIPNPIAPSMGHSSRRRFPLVRLPPSLALEGESQRDPQTRLIANRPRRTRPPHTRAKTAGSYPSFGERGSRDRCLHLPPPAPRRDARAPGRRRHPHRTGRDDRTVNSPALRTNHQRDPEGRRRGWRGAGAAAATFDRDASKACASGVARVRGSRVSSSYVRSVGRRGDASASSPTSIHRRPLILRAAFHRTRGSPKSSSDASAADGPPRRVTKKRVSHGDSHCTTNIGLDLNALDVAPDLGEGRSPPPTAPT